MEENNAYGVLKHSPVAKKALVMESNEIELEQNKAYEEIKKTIIN